MGNAMYSQHAKTFYMSILKNSLRQKFAQIPNELITDSRISNGAFRVAAYLYSRPDNWNVNNKDVQSSLGINDRGTLSKYWNELIDCGWLARELKPHDENGHFGGYDYTLLMSSTIAGKTLHGEGAPCMEKPAAEKTRSGKNPTHNNKEILNNTDNLTNTDKHTPPNGDFFSKADIEDFEEQLEAQKSEAKAPPSSATPPHKKEKPELNVSDFSGFDVPESALTAWLVWEQYKKSQFRQSYKTAESRNIAIEKLRRISGGKSKIALEIINESRSQLWSGLFELKQKNNNVKQAHNPQIINQSKYAEWEQRNGI